MIRSVCRNSILILSLILFVLSGSAFFINDNFFHFSGNNYFPKGSALLFLNLFLILIGVRTTFDKNHYASKLVWFVLMFFLVMAEIVLLTNAAQYTPFTPIDNKIVAFEHLLHIDMAGIIAWTNQHDNLRFVLGLSYDSLTYQLTIIPLAVALMGEFDRLKEFFCLLLFSAIIGFTGYYFFPTAAPASIVISHFFMPEQLATGIKFNEIHHHIPPSTLEGGMIALPSFHAIWAWFCLYLVRQWKILFFLLLAWNCLLIASCVLLGWHYFSDLLGSIILIVITHLCVNRWFLGSPTVALTHR